VRLERFIVGPIETNAWLVADEAAGEAMVVDPGGETEGIVAALRRGGFALRWILDTHGHGDHILGNAALKKLFPAAQLAVHEADAAMLTSAELNLSAAFGFGFTSPPADRLLRDGDAVEIGRIRFEIIHLPGHTPGGIGLYAPPGPATGNRGILLAGDALFAGGIGRSDFPGGSHEQLVSAIRARLLTLPPETVVHPGHGPDTTLGEEARSNPFL
jgi:glyoxylase-like metal-dependent hydrolase (beta-lactamase superfamily II)